MTTFTTHFPARTPVSLLLSVVLHGSVIAGILYTSLHYSVKSPDAPQPIAITMVAPQIQPEPAPAVVTPEPEPEPQPDPQIAPEPPKAEPVAIPKPEPKPKPKPKAEPKPKPKAEPKPKPRPVKKVEPERRPPTTAQENPFKPDKPATQTQPATAPKNTPATTTSAAAGPEALNISKPAYPARAAALRIEGKVRLKFDVNSAGRVENVTILSAEPRNMFERSVKDQAKKWRYQSGQPGKGVTMTIVFRINGGANIE